jgi:hypothetical protein
MSAEREIDELVAAFFGLFSNRDGVTPNLRAIFDLCIPEAVICKPPDVMSLESFIAPRQELLTNGTLTEFLELETSNRTDIFGNVAQRVCTYAKAGVLDGKPFQTRGLKVFQFIKTPAGWRISAVSWDDEREGLTVPDAL